MTKRDRLTVKDFPEITAEMISVGQSVVLCLEMVAIQPRQDRRSGWGADRVRAVRVREPNTLSGKMVKMGRLGDGIPIGSHAAPLVLI